jgi:hypothetical protein
MYNISNLTKLKQLDENASDEGLLDFRKSGV